MTQAELLYATHKAIERLEWIERHVSARPNNSDTNGRLADELDDMEHYLGKMLMVFAPPVE